MAAGSLPEGIERARIELGLSFSLGVAQMATKGYAALEVEQTYIRTRDLCLKLSEHRRLFPVLWGLWTYYLIGADLSKAAEVAKEMLERWEAAGDPVARIEALHAQGTTLGYMGCVIEGREYLQEALDRYRANPYRFYASVYVLDPAVSCLAMLARLEVGLGHVDRALSYVRDASELSARLNHPQSLAYASCFTGMIQFFRQDYAGSLAALDHALQLSKEHGLPQIREWCRIFRGWTQFKSGAGRRRIVRQLLTEAILLSLTGGAIGIALAYVGVPLLVALMPEYSVPHEAVIQVNGAVVLFTFAVAVFTGILFGMAPAFSAREDRCARFHAGCRAGFAGTAGAGKTRSALIVLEVALTMVLLVGAGIAIRGFLAITQAHLGFETSNVLTLQLNLPQGAYKSWDSRTAHLNRILDSIERTPGVIAAAGTLTAMPPNIGFNTGFGNTRASRVGGQSEMPHRTDL